MPTTWTGSAALAASTSLHATPVLRITIGSTVYYVTETSVSPATPYTIESGASNYTTEDGSEAYTTELVRQRYITEAGVNAVGPFYVADIGVGGITLVATATLVARARQTQQSTASLAATAALLATPGLVFADSAALSAAAALSATSTLELGATAHLAAVASLTASAGVPSNISPFVAATLLVADPALRAATSAALAAETSLLAAAGIPLFGTAVFAAETALFGDGTVVFAPLVVGEALLEASAALFGYGTRIPYPPSLVGHSLVYIVNAPIAAQLTSDPVVGPLLGNSGVSVWHTQTNSVNQLPGAWNVIFMNNKPFDLPLAESTKCVLIYDQTALVQRKDSVAVVLKNDLTPPLSDLEIVVDGFGSLIQPSTLPSLIGI